MMPDFEKLDANVRWWRAEDKNRIVNNMGYTYISEAIYYLYYVEFFSLRQVGVLIDGMDENTIRTHMNKWGWKRRGPGGPNFKGRKK